MTQPPLKSRRDEILCATLAIIEGDGVDGVTMARVAEQTGLSRPAVYQYFASREHILGELLIDDMADLSNEIDRIVASVDDPMEQIRLWIHYSLAHMASADHLVVREISMIHLREDHRGELMAMHGYFLTTLISPLRELGVEDPSSLVSLIFSAINASAQRIYSGKSFVSEASALEKFVIAGVEGAL
jgi:AcrR family transcriptional regulator